MIIENTDKPKVRQHGAPESRIQAEAFTWFCNTYPQYRGLLFAVANQNERSGELSKHAQLISGAMRRAIGVTAGVSDMLCLIPRGQYHGLMLEAKTAIGKQSIKQIEWQKKVEEQGYIYRIFRSKEEFKQIVEWYLSL